MYPAADEAFDSKICTLFQWWKLMMIVCFKQLTEWFFVNQSPASMVKSLAGGGKGTGITDRLKILKPPKPPAALWKAREGK